MAIRTYSKGQKITYRYPKVGSFQAGFSGNISSASFAGYSESTPFQVQLTAIQNLSSSVKKLDDYAFYGCYNLVSANLGDGITALGNQCFEKCQSLQSLNLPRSCLSIGNQAFASSRNLSGINYLEYEQDLMSEASELKFELQYIGSNVISGTPMLNDIVFPDSITNIVSQISQTALDQASISSITFLGMSSSELMASQASIAESQLLGLASDCEIIASDGKKLKYTNNGRALVIDDTFSLYGKARIQTGKLNRLKLGRTIYWFTEQLYQWCMDPSSHDPERFPNPSQCPFIVFYGDFLTSKKTKLFLQRILETPDFQDWIKETLKCFLFLADRNGCISSGDCSLDVDFFRRVHQEKNGIADFVVIDFFYGSNFWSTTFSPGTLDDLKNIINEGMEKCNFQAFDAEPYEYQLDVLEPETIPTGEINSNQLKLLCGNLPWWFDGTNVKRGTIRKLSSDKFNFQVLSTPETTYLLVGAYDERNPTNFPTAIKTKTAPMWKPYADTIQEIYNGDCLNGGFTKLFEQGPKYRHFICFEFSHGAPKRITIDHKLTYTKIWEVLRACKGKVFMMFDSCDSGSMFQAKNLDNNTADSTTQSEESNVGSYLIQKFQRRSQLMKSLFGASTEDIDPQIICWSSTTASTYGWYRPTSDTIWAIGLRATNSQCQGQRYRPAFLVNKREGFYAHSSGDCIPQRKSYQTKNGVQIIGECKKHEDNGIEIDAEKCIIWS